MTKVITREMLIKFAQERPKDSPCDSERTKIYIQAAGVVLDLMLNHPEGEILWKEIDEITVSKLRPVADMPKDGTFLIVENFTGAKFHEYSPLEDGPYDDGELKGWIPMPQYELEQKS